jgi:hypothetical protein
MMIRDEWVVVLPTGKGVGDCPSYRFRTRVAHLELVAACASLVRSLVMEINKIVDIINLIELKVYAHLLSELSRGR